MLPAPRATQHEKHPGMNRHSFIATVAAMLAMLLSTSLAFASVKPLLMEGKKSLYQRVVSKPGASTSDKPSSANARPAPAFSIYYVYARKKLGTHEWLQVADNTEGKKLRWIAADQVIPWNQGLTVIFRNPLTQERVLLFKDEQSLKKLVEKDDKQRYQALYRQAVAGKTSADSPVIAIQPDYNIDPARQFYVAPILAHEDIFFGDGQAKLLKVATVPDVADDKPTPKPAEQAFRAGVVFVIDSTLSMGPYIDRTREAIRKIYRRLEKSGGAGRLRFGLIAFRDNVDAVKGLEYVSRTYATLKQGGDEQQFFALVDQVEPAEVSSQDFREDAYAGVKAALDDIDWKGVDARYLVLISDAGPRKADDPLASTGLSAEALNKLARRNNISITVLHLLTPKGKDDHEPAREAYQTLSRYPGVGSLYYGVEAGDVSEFGKAVDALSRQIGDSVKTAMGKAGVTEKAENPSDSLDALTQKISRIGHALRIQYLKRDQRQPPSLVSAWVVDHSLVEPSRKTLDVGVLMTRNQLGDLHDRLAKTLTSFQDGLLAPDNFIDNIRSVAAALARDPKQLESFSADADLAALGLMQEYIEDLPYQSEAMTISLDEWRGWPVEKQVRFVHRLEEKLAYYQALYDHTDMWYSPGGGAVNGESVIALSLDMLP